MVDEQITDNQHVDGCTLDCKQGPHQFHHDLASVLDDAGVDAEK